MGASHMSANPLQFLHMFFHRGTHIYATTSNNQSFRVSPREAFCAGFHSSFSFIISSCLFVYRETSSRPSNTDLNFSFVIVYRAGIQGHPSPTRFQERERPKQACR